MVKRGYDRRMRTEGWLLQGEAVSDERQLDGSRHLAIEAGGEAQGERVLLRLVISREGALTEGELEMEGGREAWSGGLLRQVRVDSDSPLRARARFGDPNVERGARWMEVMEGDEPGLFAVTLRSD